MSVAIREQAPPVRKFEPSRYRAISSANIPDVFRSITRCEAPVYYFPTQIGSKIFRNTDSIVMYPSKIPQGQEIQVDNVLQEAAQIIEKAREQKFRPSINNEKIQRSKQTPGEIGAQVLSELWADPVWSDNQKQRLRKHGSLMMRRLWSNQAWADKKRKVGEQLFTEKWKDPDWRRWKVEVLSRNGTGKKHTNEARNAESMKKGGIRVGVLRYALRGGTNEEIAQITSFSYEQVERFTKNGRKNGDLPIPTSEERFQIRSRANKLQRLKAKHGGEFPLEIQRSFVFARSLHKAGVISEDLTTWDKLMSFYSENGKELPENFAEKVRLEVFYEAVEGVLVGNEGLMALYTSLLKKVDPKASRKGLTEDEQFVFETMMAAKTSQKSKVQDVRKRKVDRVERKLEAPRVEELSVEAAESGSTPVSTSGTIFERKSRERFNTKRILAPVMSNGDNSGLKAKEDLVQRELALKAAGDIAKIIEYIDEQYSKLAYSVALRVLHDMNDAEEAVFNGYTKLYRSSQQYLLDPDKSFTSALRTCIESAAIDIRRRRQREHQHGPISLDQIEKNGTSSVKSDGKSVLTRDAFEYAYASDNSLEDSVIDDVTTQRVAEKIREVLHKLPENKRRLVELTLEGLTHAQIAEGKGIPLGTVKTRLRSAYEELRQLLLPVYEEFAA